MPRIEERCVCPEFCCRGSGVYRDSKDPKGYGFVCWRCHGRGWVKQKTVPKSDRIRFVQRTERMDVRVVFYRADTLRDGILYKQEFLRGTMPPNIPPHYRLVV